MPSVRGKPFPSQAILIIIIIAILSRRSASLISPCVAVMKRIGVFAGVLLASLGLVSAFQVGSAGGLCAPAGQASASVLSLRGGFGSGLGLRKKKRQELGGRGCSSKSLAKPGGASPAMLGSVGGMSSKGDSGSVRAKVELGVLIFLWYATSVRQEARERDKRVRAFDAPLMPPLISCAKGLVAAHLFALLHAGCSRKYGFVLTAKHR